MRGMEREMKRNRNKINVIRLLFKAKYIPLKDNSICFKIKFYDLSAYLIIRHRKYAF